MVVASDGSGFAMVPAGEPIPETADGLTFTPGLPEVSQDSNITTVGEDGRVIPLEFPTQSTGDPRPFRIEGADGCTTVTGAATSMFGTEPPARATTVDGGFRICGDGSEPLGGLLFFISGSLLQLPSVSVVETGGQWYVSPLGSVLATATLGLHDIGDGSSLFRSVLGPYIYGIPASFLGSVVVGRSADELNAACLPALTVENGVVTGILDDPPVDAIRACGNSSFDSVSSSTGTGFSPAPNVTEATAIVVPESTTP
jgi:hypothetical protein